MVLGARHLINKRGWTNPYVTDGLIAMWDGEWNAGPGVHDANATVWANIAENASIELDISSFRFHFGDKSLVPDEELNDAYHSNTKYPITAGTIRFVRPIAFEVVFASDYVSRRWGAYPWTSSCESWITGNELLERLYNTRISNIVPAEKRAEGLYCATTLDSNNLHRFITYLKDGTKKSTQATVTYNFNIDYRFAFVNPMRAGENLYAIRVYTKALTDSEVAANYAVDKARFLTGGGV